MKTHQSRPRAMAIALRGFLTLCAISVVASYGLLLGWLVDQSPWLGLAAGAVVLVPTLQITCSLLLYAQREDAELPAWQGQHSIDVFVTVCNEPRALICSTARAARDIRGEHQTWLLDDGNSEDTRAIADELGINYLARPGNKDAKAGSLNYALKRTSGDIVAVFDVDHRPRADFLERTVGHFQDAKVGFVQTSLTYRNQPASWTAKAAAEFGTEYFSLVNAGKSRVGAATMMGSNSLIRRQALESIGGYRPGLAEDLETSIAMHAAGWKSRHVDEPLAPGLAPEDLIAWDRQQSKWTRGVLHAATNALSNNFWRLNWAQRSCYLLRFSYYLTGPLILLSLLTVTILAACAAPIAEEALLRLTPIFLFAAIGRACATLAWVRPESGHARGTWRAAALAISSWPTTCRAWLGALTNAPQRHVATPKSRARSGFRATMKWPAASFVALFGVLGFNVAFRPEAVVATPLIHAAGALMLCAHVALLLSLPTGMLRRRLAEVFLVDDNDSNDAGSNDVGSKRPQRDTGRSMAPGFSHAARTLPTRIQPELAKVQAASY